MNALSPTGTAVSWLQERRNTVALLGILGLVAALVAGWSALPTQAQPTIAPFTDIADEDHLGPEVYQSFGRRPGVGLFDYNQDGWLDIYLTSVKGEPNFLYRNNSDGTFTNVAAEAGVEDLKGNSAGVAAADFNNDGWPDLYVANRGSIGDKLDYRSGGDQGNLDTLLLNVEAPGGERVFQDVTEVAGIDNPRSASSIVAADVNNDTLLDIYVTNVADEDFPKWESVNPEIQNNHHRNTFYLNMGPNDDGVPIFEDVTDAADVASAGEKNRDLNGDPITTFDPEFVDAEGNLIGDPDGNITHAALFTDIDGDGDQDLLTGDDFNPLTVYRNDGDTDGDGVPNFTDVSRLAGTDQVGNWMGFASADYDGDGDLDYFVTNMGSQVLTEEGFDRYNLQRFSWGNRMVALLRHDGVRELPEAGVIPVVPNVASAIQVEPSAAMPPRALDARNVDPRFEPVQGLEAYEFGFGATFFDLENDGDPDLYYVGDVGGGPDDGGIGPLFFNSGRLLRNQGDGSFADKTIEARAITMKDFPWDRVDQPDFDALEFLRQHHVSVRALVAGDLNNDGYTDLVVPADGTPDEPGPLFILINQNEGNDWVKVKTTGTDSNRDGVGARVTLTVNSARGPEFQTQVGEVQVGSSYQATEDKDLVFGLGRRAGRLRLRVEWPSGRVDVYDNVRRNSLFEAVEGEGRAG